ncbi:hypothetical protein PWT90_10196 [Aphanocladium album]|nr:hypothetical protein PWT90_10196 [Aphanocladium album]
MKTTAIALLSVAGVLAAPRANTEFDRSVSSSNTAKAAKHVWGAAIHQGQGYASGWVAIDAILQTGVQAYGDGTLRAGYEWYPDLPVYDERQVPRQGRRRDPHERQTHLGGVGQLHAREPHDGQDRHHDLHGQDDGSLHEGRRVGRRIWWRRDHLCHFWQLELYNTEARSASSNVTAAGSLNGNVEVDGKVMTSCSASSAVEVDCSYVV